MFESYNNYSVFVNGNKIVYIASSIVININLFLFKFINIFPYLFTLLRLNTINCFQFVDVLRSLF